MEELNMPKGEPRKKNGSRELVLTISVTEFKSRLLIEEFCENLTLTMLRGGVMKVLPLNPENGSKPGFGMDEREAILDWVAKNLGPSQVVPSGVCTAALAAALLKADPRAVQKLTQKLLDALRTGLSIS